MRAIYSIAWMAGYLVVGISSALVPYAEAFAGVPIVAGGWKFYKDEHRCSLARAEGTSFVFLGSLADGRQFLRFHNKDWHFAEGVPVQVRLAVGSKTFDLAATGAATSNGWQGFTALSQADVLSALSLADQASITTGGSSPLGVDLSGLHEAMPILLQCAATLSKQELVEAPMRGSRLVRAPSISGRDLPPGERPKGSLRYQLIVGPDGKPTECQVLQSSGSPAVDERVCALLKERSIFEPALDHAGRPAVSEFRSHIDF